MLTGPSVRGRRGRRGFTFMEMVVALVILIVLAGVVTPQVVQRLSHGEAATLASNLRHLSDAMLAFRGDVGRYPARLSSLSGALTAGSLDTCGGAFPDPAVWKGPYLTRPISGSGLFSGGGIVIQDQVVRTPVGGAGSRLATLSVEALSVERPVAVRLEAAFDGDANFGAGSIRWSESPAGSNSGKLSFDIPVRGC